MGVNDRSCPSLELPNSNRCSFYFTRLSVDEEGFYSVIPKSLVPEVREGIGRIPEALTIIKAYKELAAIDLPALLNSPCLDLEDAQLHKLYQTGLYAILALYIKRRLGLRIDAVGFYSGGATSAFLFAGAYTASDYIQHIFPFNRMVREQMAIEGRDRSLAQVLLMGDVGEDIDKFVSCLIESRFPEIFVKDRRQSHAVLIAGPREPVMRLVEEADRQFPAIASKRSPILKHRFASHSPYLNADSLSAGLDTDVFSLPTTAVVGAKGEILRPGHDARSDMKRVFADGVIGPMNTGRAIGELARFGKRILVIGSSHAAKVLAGLKLPADTSIDLAAEMVAQVDPQIIGKPVYDGRVTEYAAG